MPELSLYLRTDRDSPCARNKDIYTALDKNYIRSPMEHIGQGIAIGLADRPLAADCFNTLRAISAVHIENRSQTVCTAVQTRLGLFQRERVAV